MKNKLKSVRSSSKSAAASQPKTKAPKEKAESSGHIAGVVTCVWVEPNGREWARVEFPRALFARIQRAARKLNVTLEQFFDNAIRHYSELLMGRRSA